MASRTIKGEGVLIRDFRKSDLGDIIDLLPKCFATEFEISGFDPDHMRDMMNRAYGSVGRLLLGTSRLLGREPIKFLVAEANHRIIGTTIVNSEGRVGYISAVMVAPENRRRGIATTLVQDAIEYIHERKMQRAVLHVVSANAPARGVYSRLGFKEFEQVVHLVAAVDSIFSEEDATGLEIRPYLGTDIDETYNLYLASENPNHLRIFGFDKNQLKSPFWQRLFRFGTSRRIVALRDGKIVGSIVASYTTAKEAGSISSMHVRPDNRSQGIEKGLARAAIGEIRKGKAERIVAMVPATRPELVETLKDLGFVEAMVLIGMYKESPEDHS